MRRDYFLLTTAINSDSLNILYKLNQSKLSVFNKVVDKWMINPVQIVVNITTTSGNRGFAVESHTKHLFFSDFLANTQHTNLAIRKKNKKNKILAIFCL